MTISSPYMNNEKPMKIFNLYLYLSSIFFQGAGYDKPKVGYGIGGVSVALFINFEMLFDWFPQIKLSHNSHLILCLLSFGMTLAYYLFHGKGKRIICQYYRKYRWFHENFAVSWAPAIVISILYNGGLQYMIRVAYKILCRFYQ